MTTTINKTRPYPLAILVLAGFTLYTSAQAETYTFTDLSSLGASNNSATAINTSGQVVGYNVDTNYFWHAILWNEETSSNLSTPEGSSSGAYAVNNSGQVAGFQDITGNGYNPRATLWSGNTFKLLSSQNIQANAINDSGQIVGWSYGDTGEIPRATLWHGSNTIDLGGLEENESSANAINASGQVAGYSRDNGGKFKAALWNEQGTITNLGALGGGSIANAINASGQVVGWSQINNDTITHATLWQGGTTTDLGTLLGGDTSIAYSINTSGQIVGQSNTLNGDTRATLWSGGTLTDLNNLLDIDTVNAGWVLSVANGINDHGWIVGNAYNSLLGINSRAFLLTPVPLPASAWLFSSAILALINLRKRRFNQIL